MTIYYLEENKKQIRDDVYRITENLETNLLTIDYIYDGFHRTQFIRLEDVVEITLPIIKPLEPKNVFGNDI